VLISIKTQVINQEFLVVTIIDDASMAAAR
jgi:hypothetical protein